MRQKLIQIEHTNIDHKVYKIISEQILNGVLAPGARLTEEQLAEELGVSRTPVREAMKRLAQDELVDLLPRRGMYVRKLNREDVAEIYEVRMGLEGLATFLATSRISDGDLVELRYELEFANSELASGRVKAWLDFDTKFHAILVDGCANKRLQKMLDKLNTLVGYFRTHLAQRNERAEQALGEHEIILAALRERDPARSEAAMRVHIKSAGENILKDINFKD